jgi:hypothetical protein
LRNVIVEISPLSLPVLKRGERDGRHDCRHRQGKAPAVGRQEIKQGPWLRQSGYPGLHQAPSFRIDLQFSLVRPDKTRRLPQALQFTGAGWAGVQMGPDPIGFGRAQLAVQKSGQIFCASCAIHDQTFR